MTGYVVGIYGLHCLNVWMESEMDWFLYCMYLGGWYILWVSGWGWMDRLVCFQVDGLHCIVGWVGGGDEIWSMVRCMGVLHCWFTVNGWVPMISNFGGGDHLVVVS